MDYPTKEVRTTGSLSQINLTPLVDVMMVLLIIFMITAPFMFQGAQVNLPKTKMGKAQTEEHYVITIKKDKHVYINNQPINIHLLEERLAQLSAVRQDKKIFIKADNDVPYGFVLLVMDKAKAAGIENFGLITEPIIK
jgi:biopolymer transport protein TolR